MSHTRIASAGTILCAMVISARAFAGQPCPAGGASLRVNVDNRSGATSTVQMKGSRAGGTCNESGLGLQLVYDSTPISCISGQTDCFTVSNLAPGIWRNQIIVTTPNLGQHQYIETIVVGADPAGFANVVNWKVFKSVLTVDRTDDIQTAACPSGGTATCTLRNAMAAGATANAPLLVQFDSTVFPLSNTAVNIDPGYPGNPALTLDGNGMMVDGRDALGEPSLWIPTTGKPRTSYNRIVNLPGTANPIIFKNQDAVIAGLEIKRTLNPGQNQPDDVVIFEGTTTVTNNNVVMNCKIDGGAGGLTSPATGKDGVGSQHKAGSSWAKSNKVRMCEITGAQDKGIKSTLESYVTAEDNWIHHNLDVGIQATLSGRVEANHNLVENNGRNAAGTEVSTSAQGIAANGQADETPTIAAELKTDGNIIRNNLTRGISVREKSIATIKNDYVCGTKKSGTSGGQNGIAILGSGNAASANVRGSTVVYNGGNGATVNNISTGDFGTNDLSDPGNNAFVKNATVITAAHNFDDSSTQTNIPAVFNQWEHCGTVSSGCNNANIASLDISGTISFTPTQFQRSTATFQIDSFVPKKVALQDDFVRIVGRGFNAIEGHPGGGDCTTTPAANNTCGSAPNYTPTGTCVQVELTANTWTNMSIQSITPTEIVAKWPDTLGCAKPVNIRVRKLDENGAPLSTSFKKFCTNS